MSFILKVHDSPEGRIAAVCDEDVLGSVFYSGEDVLDVDSFFFGGVAASLDDIACAIEGAASANIVGCSIVGELLLRGIVREGGVKEIGGVKFAHVYRI